MARVWSLGVLKALNVVHRGVTRATFGRVGWTAARMPVLALTTTGRRSGLPRTVLLTSPLQIDEAIVVVASRGGHEHHPDWFLNLCERPDVVVDWRGVGAVPMRARVVGAEERARLWPRVVERYAGYSRYQAATDREIPLVVLSPAER